MKAGRDRIVGARSRALIHTDTLQFDSDHTKCARCARMGCKMALLALLLPSLVLHDVGLSATVASLDEACLQADALGYDGRQLAGHGADALRANAALIGHVPYAPSGVFNTPGAFTQRATFPPLACRQVTQLVQHLGMMPSPGMVESSVDVQLDSVDGLPEFQVDILQSQPLVDLVWPFVEQWVVPSLADLYGLQLDRMRVAEMFVRRYDSGVRGGRANHPVHSDASTVSVSIELSTPSEFEGGLFFSRTRPGSIAAQGSAVYHFGNTTHFVSVSRGSRWSLVLFFFSSCEAQLRYTTEVLPLSLQQRTQSSRLTTHFSNVHDKDENGQLHLPKGTRALYRRGVEAYQLTVPRWIAAATAEVAALPESANRLVDSGLLSCPPGTEWTPRANLALGYCTACAAGMFSPQMANTGISSSETPLVRAECRRCRPGFFSP